ncbi:MAG: acyl carrier protein [Clostridia bacterium]|nr:acyl carrier protein [Clostridia bacterium]
MHTCENKLVTILENYVEADEIKGEDSFKSDLGISSFEIMCLISDVRNELGVELTAADFIKHKTVGSMAEYISSKV